jgi:small subunit ribosomal protein S4
MKIRSKYKIARRVGAPVFEKTQTQKFAAREARRERRNPSRSDYGIQLVEKQKVRFTYVITAKMLAKYIKQALAKKSTNPQELLFTMLETRLDNVAYRVGFAPTRLAARQMVSHGHIIVNGRKLNIPSYQVKQGDVIAVRPQSMVSSKLFSKLEERLAAATVPSWISYKKEDGTATIKGLPKLAESEVMFNLGQAIEFHSR